MHQTTVHNPDRFMVDLRQILSQGRKRIGLLIGAGAPVALKVDKDGNVNADGNPIIPDVKRLTQAVLDDLTSEDIAVIDALFPESNRKKNIEIVLTRIRRLSQAIHNEKIHNLTGEDYTRLATRICEKIGRIVAPRLPEEPNPFTELVSWIGGAHRDHPIEIFTPNYDLLLEEAFERARLPYYDGFTGAHQPFFDPASISEDMLPSRWSRLWKIHGSLGWEISSDRIIRTGSRDASMLIYPDHLKYDEITRQPYSALFERLRTFLKTPDSLLLCSGFSFSDAQITAVIDDSLAANAHTAVLAFQHRSLADEDAACNLAHRRPNLSVYARDGAVIFGVSGQWQPGRPPTEEWESVRDTFWRPTASDSIGEFLLGDFAMLSRFCLLAQANTFKVEAELTEEVPGNDAAQIQPTSTTAGPPEDVDA